MTSYRALSIYLILIINPITLNSKPDIKHLIKAAVYADRGVGVYPGKSRAYARNIAAIISSIDRQIYAELIYSKSIKKGKLKKFDVIIFPGGTGSGQMKSLGEKGRLKVKKFVENGGGYIGICAGAYIGKKSFSPEGGYELSLMNATLFNKGRFWNRGAGIIQVKLSDKGRKYLPELENSRFFNIFYMNGPLLVRADTLSGQNYEKIITFKTDIYHGNPGGKGDAPGKGFIVKGGNDLGVVILISGHPEATPGLRWILPRMIRVASKNSIIEYPDRFINTKKFSKIILFNNKWGKKEKKYLKILKSSSVNKKINAIKKLKNMASWQLVYILPGLLFNKSESIKRKAAETIIFYDYFPALNSLKMAFTREKNNVTKDAFRKAIKYLSIN